MKAFILSIALMGTLASVKAQQLQLSPNSKTPLNTFQLKVDTSLNKYFKPDNKANGLLISPKIYSNALVAMNTDRMPIAKLNNTDPGMPIVQTDRTGYTMPVVGKSLPRVYTMKTNTVTTLNQP